jgi:hypothetical protein
MGGQADVFTITSQSAVLDVNTGRYIEQPSNLGDGSPLLMGKTPVAWTFALAGPALATRVVETAAAAVRSVSCHWVTRLQRVTALPLRSPKVVIAARSIFCCRAGRAIHFCRRQRFS